MIEDSIRLALLADPAVAALVGTRVWPIRLPQTATLPAIVYQRISTPVGMGLTGPAGPVAARVQLGLWATSFDAARELLGAVRAALKENDSDEQRMLFAGSEDGIQAVSVSTWADDHFAGPPERFRVRADLFVHSREGVAA